jgi:hypothetical protein
LILIEVHIYHLVGQGSPHEIFEKDVLNYEAQIKSWANADGVFVVHYDDLWKKSDELSDYLGFKLRLPERRDRTVKIRPSNINQELFDHLRQQERSLRNKICLSASSSK